MLIVYNIYIYIYILFVLYIYIVPGGARATLACSRGGSGNGAESEPTSEQRGDEAKPKKASPSSPKGGSERGDPTIRSPKQLFQDMFWSPCMTFSRIPLFGSPASDPPLAIIINSYYY